MKTKIKIKIKTKLNRIISILTLNIFLLSIFPVITYAENKTGKNEIDYPEYIKSVLNEKQQQAQENDSYPDLYKSETYLHRKQKSIKHRKNIVDGHKPFTIDPVVYNLTQQNNNIFEKISNNYLNKNKAIVKPDRDTIINYKGIVLEIQKGSVTKNTAITIEEIQKINELNPGMNNVTLTQGNRNGYRFLPSMNFEKKIRVTIPFNKNFIQSDEELYSLYTYYFNEETNKWEKLPRIDIDREKGLIISETDHFTDMINSTLELPESPKPLSYNPTSIKDIKAANPLTEIPKIEGLEANSYGTANFNLPIRIPHARNGLTPEITLNYNSGSGNGWLGMGFNIDIPCITIDTTFGLPLYDDKQDTFKLNGQELVYIDETSEGLQFRTRIETFSKIIKKDGKFEVTSPDGVKQIFGNSDAKLDGGKGTYIYYLKQVIDPNGNTITYNYTTVNNYTYLQTIQYTGHTSGETGNYTVEFINEKDRTDKIVNCRGKFKSVLGWRLKEIQIKYKSGLVRKYAFTYKYNQFYKSEITDAIEYDSEGNEFYRYTFDYYEMEQANDGVKGFQDAVQWGAADNNDKLNRSHTISAGGSVYVGIGWAYNLSIGVNTGLGFDYGFGSMKFMDFDGDNLPDVIWKDPGSPGWKYRVNNGENGFDGAEYVEGLNRIVDNTLQINFDFGIAGSVGPLSASAGANFSFVNSFDTFADVNGDGLIDYIPGGYSGNYYKNEGSGKLAASNWEVINETDLLPIDNGVGNSEYKDEFDTAYHLIDPVAKWVPYKPGKIKISGSIIKIDDTDKEDGDGIQAFIYKNNNELYSAEMKNGDADLPHENILDITLDDNIYFRITGIDNITNDLVLWNPVIEYEEIKFFHDMDMYNIAFYKDVYLPGEFDEIYDKCNDEQKDFLLNTCYILEKDEEENPVKYTLDAGLSSADINEMKKIMIDIDYMIPKIINTDIFENMLSQQVFNDDLDYIVVNPDGQTNVDKDKFFITNAYKKEITGRYYILKKELINASGDNIFDPETRGHMVRLFSYFKGMTFSNSLKFYKYNGSCKQVKKEDGEHFIENKYKKNLNCNSVIKVDSAEQIGDITDTGILVEIIEKEGIITKNYIKDTGSSIKFYHEDENGVIQKINNIDTDRDGDELKIVYKLTDKIKTYKLTRNDDIPELIEDSIYLSFYENELSLPIPGDEFNTMILNLQTLGEDTGIIEASYILDEVNEIYNPGTGIPEPDKHEILRQLTLLGRIESYYSLNSNYYQLKTNHDEDFIKEMLEDNDIYLFDELTSSAKIFETKSYTVYKTGYTGETEDTVSYPYYENSAGPFSSYILEEDFDTEGKTKFIRQYIHVFSIESDINYTGDFPAYAEPDNTQSNPVKDKYYKRVYDYFGGGVYNWFYGEWNGMLAWDENKIGVFNEDNNYTYYTRMEIKKSDYSNVHDLSNSKTYTETNILEKDIWHGTETSYTEMKFDDDGNKIEEDKYFASYISGAEFCPSRVGGDAKEKIDNSSYAKSPADSGGSVAKGTPGHIGLTFSWGLNAALSLGGGSSLGINANIGQSYNLLGIMDINGDRYPDKLEVNPGKVVAKINEGGGYGKYKLLSGVEPFIRKEMNINYGLGVSAGPAGSWMKPKYDENGTLISVEPDKASDSNSDGVIISLGAISYNGNIGESKTMIDFIDINGDGLADQVIREGEGNINVRLNLGGEFQQETWDSYEWGEKVLFSAITGDAPESGFGDPDYLRYANMVTAGAGISFGIKDIGISGNVNIAGRRTKIDLIDMNGDGLPDQVFKTGNSDYFLVKYNLGECFADEPVKWYTPSWQIDDNFNIDNYVISFINEKLSEVTAKTGGDTSLASNIASQLNYFSSNLKYFQDINIFGAEDVISYTGSLSFGIGVNFGQRYGPLGLSFLYVYVTPGINFSYNHGETDLTMVDINGDGLPDHVLKVSGQDYFRVKLNNAKKTGLLKSITTPGGSLITLEYDRLVNTPENPNESYILTGVTKTDGMSNSYTAEYEYRNGYYSRSERLGYGYETVIVTNPDGSYMVKSYHNDNYYSRNILHHTENYDVNGNKYSESDKIYDFTVTESSNKSCVFPMLQKAVITVIDTENSESISTGIDYVQYDSYGNIKKAIDRGDLNNTQDDVYIQIEYEYNTSKYIVSKPCELIASESTFTGKVLRRKWGYYDSKGNLEKHEEYCNNDDNPVYTYIYDDYGNKLRVTDSNGYYINYTYDTENNQFTEQVKDSLDYTSKSVYDYAAQVEIQSIDTNNNSIYRDYDSFTRPVKIYTDYDSTIPSIEYKYYHKEFPARAVTKNKIHFDQSDNETLDTVIITDGLRRIIQTKKEGEIADRTLNNTIYGMNVTGLAEYDNMGRVILQSQPVFIESNGNTDPDDPLSIYGYEPVQQKNPTELVYDAQGRHAMTIFPDSRQVTNEYAIENGLFKITVTDPKGSIKISRTDAKDNIVSIDKFNNSRKITTNYTYNRLNEIISITDTQNNITGITYDTLGRKIAIDSPDAGLTEYKYNANSNLIEKTDNNLRAKSQKIKYEYDLTGRLIKVDYPESNDITYTYGASNDTAYNRAGRIASINDDCGKTEFYYGILGEEQKVIKTFTCLTDNVSRKYEFNYQYDYLGRMESITYPGTHNRSTNAVCPAETVYYEYDLGGAVKSVTGMYPDAVTGITYAEDIKYDEFGQRVYIKYGNGVETKYTYDENRRLLTNIKTINNTNKILQDMNYEFDETGNILSITNNIINKVDQVFEYDDLNQLTYAKGSYENVLYNTKDNYEQTYSYDNIGNITGKISKQWNHLNKGEEELNYELDYTYDTDHPHQALEISGTSYDYDANGNLIKKYIPAGTGSSDNSQVEIVDNDDNSADYAIGWDWQHNTSSETVIAEYMWNEENRLIQAVTSSDTVTFKYDSAGERVHKYAEDKSEVLYADSIYELGVGTYKDCITKHIFVGTSRIVSKISYEDLQNNAETEKRNTFYHSPDHLGSSNITTNRYGEEYKTAVLTPYGELWLEETDGNTQDTLLDIRFTDKPVDEETNLCYFGARYYDAKTSLWISCDPALEEYLPKVKKIAKKKKELQQQELEANPLLSLFKTDTKNQYLEVYNSLPGNGGIYNTNNLDLYCYASNNPLKYVDPTGEKVYSVSVGVEAYVVVGGKIDIAVVWDDHGNWGLAITVAGGFGVKVGVDIPGIKPLVKKIIDVVSSGGLDFHDTIYDTGGLSFKADAAMLFSGTVDMNSSEFTNASFGEVGGCVYAEYTLVIPISDAPEILTELGLNAGLGDLMLEIEDIIYRNMYPIPR